MPSKTVRIARRCRIADQQQSASILIDFSIDLPESEIREERDASGREVWVVSDRWLQIGDKFGQQLLNRHFSRLLLRERPNHVDVQVLCGATLDFVRIAGVLGIRASFRPPDPALLPTQGSRAAAWIRAALQGAVVSGGTSCENEMDALRKLLPECEFGGANACLPDCESSAGLSAGYDAYAFGQRDHALLFRMQEPLVRHFEGCRTVLDVGCGTGLFLELLDRVGIAPTGVERSPNCLRYARGFGHEIVESDALEYLETTHRQFDGVYCSHFVEHLPVAGVDRLIAGVARVLKRQGIVLFVFPDPESIRSQLLGFWRDPEHVRFYHPDLIAMIGEIHGLACEYHSHDKPGRRVVPFAMDPPFEQHLPGFEVEECALTVSPELPLEAMPETFFDRALGVFGLASRTRLDRLAARLDKALGELARRQRQVEHRDQGLRGAVATLWGVNQTWAWEDNAVIRLRKQDQ